MKSVLPLLVVISTVAFTGPALACAQHQSHAALKTADAAIPPPAQPSKVVAEPVAQSLPAPEAKAEAAMSEPLGAAYEDCHRAHRGKTVYLTQ